MSCCTVDGTGKFFSKSAGYYARKFQRRGIDRTQQLIVRHLESLGIGGKSVLEVGCGVGGLILTLLRGGASSAVGVEVSDGMAAKALELASGLGLSDRVRYIVGDFVRMNGSVQKSDIVILDKVLCCTAEPALMAERSALQCERWLAVSYPRDALIPRLGFKGNTFLGRLLGWSFYPFYYEPAELDRLIITRGFREVARGQTPIWQVKIFERTIG